MRLIFQENCTILANERFTGKFTSHFIDKLVIGLYEGFIFIEQKIMKERIKNISIGEKVWLEAKSKNAQEIDCFGKLILCSNDEKNFMQIDKDENRFAVIVLSEIEHDNTTLLEDIAKEVPAFLHYLLERPLFYTGHKSRFWFDPEVYHTPGLGMAGGY